MEVASSRLGWAREIVVHTRGVSREYYFCGFYPQQQFCFDVFDVLSPLFVSLVVKLDDVELDDGPVLQHALEVEHGEVERLVRALQQELRHGPSHRRRLDRYLSAAKLVVNEVSHGGGGYLL